jgi:hypothetical protein
MNNAGAIQVSLNYPPPVPSHTITSNHTFRYSSFRVHDSLTTTDLGDDYILTHSLVQVQVQVTLRLTVSQSVSKSWCRAPSGAHDQMFITIERYGFVFLWDALSDERMGLSFLHATGPCQRSLSRVRVPCVSRPHFTVSDLRHPFSSPPTTRRVTVEVFDPASTRVNCLKSKS